MGNLFRAYGLGLCLALVAHSFGTGCDGGGSTVEPGGRAVSELGQAGLLSLTIEAGSTLGVPGSPIDFTASWSIDPEVIASPPYKWSYVLFWADKDGESNVVAGFGPVGFTEQPVTRSIIFEEPGVYDVFCTLVPSESSPGNVSDRIRVRIAQESEI